MRGSRALLACVAAVGALAVVAPAVSADAAVFTPSTGNVKLAGGVTLSTTGYGSVTCSNFSVTGSSNGAWSSLLGPTYRSTCDNGRTFDFRVVATGQVDAGAYSLQGYSAGQGFFQRLPLGPEGTTYWGGPAWAAGPFVNGSTSSPSTLTFSNVVIGAVYGDSVRMSGTVQVTTPTGGLVTLN